MTDLVLEGVRKNFGSVVAVENVDLCFQHSQLTALLGPSGCGKTTLLRMIAGLELPSAGKIRIGNNDITRKRAESRNFGMVFQSFALFPHMSVADNVAYSLRIARKSRSHCEERALELLKLVQLEDFGERRIGELSGGQRQRVAVARALAQEPEVFLLDEPMSALDAQLRGDMQMELRLLQQRLGITTIVVTHDQREAMTMADKIVVMSKGRVEQIGTPQEIYHKPVNSFVASFIGNANLLPVTFADAQVCIGEARFDVPADMRAEAGSHVTLFCRPEAVKIHDSAPSANSISAEVTFVKDLGSSLEVHLQTSHGHLIAETGGGLNPSVSIGDRVHAELPETALRVLPGDTGNQQ